MKFTFSILILFLGVFFIAPHSAHAALIAKAPNNLGLAAYWSMDDGNGILAGDSSGNGNNGTLSGTTTPTWVSGKRGKGLNFDGSSSYVTGNGSALPNVGAAANITITAWIKTNTISGTREIFNKGQSGGCFGYGMVLVSGVVNARNSGSDSPLGSATVGINTWQQVAVVFNGSGATGYINASSTGTSSQVTTSCAANSWSIGRRSYDSSSEYFSGIIDDVRIYNRALTASEISDMYRSGQLTRKQVTNQGLVGYWSMNEGRGNSVGDSSGLGNSATLSGNMTWATGKRGKGLSLNGTAGSLQLASNTNTLLNNNQNTLAMWVYVVGTGPNTYTELYANAGGVTAGSTNFWLLGNSLMFNVNGILYTYTVSLTRALNVWNHIAVTIDRQSNIGTVYLNGVYQGQVSLPSYTPGGSSPVIGSNRSTGNGSDYLNGSIDDVRIYNRILSAAEIQTLYRQNETKMNSSQNTRMTDGLVGLWSFNGPDYNPASTTAEVLDASGQGNNADAINGLATMIGKVGQAGSFDGVDDYASITRSSVLDLLSTDFTLSAWIKISGGAGGFRIIVSKNNGLNTPSYEFGLSNNNKLAFYQSGLPVKESTTAPSMGVWHHVVFTFNNTAKTGAFYLNGVADGVASTLNNTVTTSLPLYLGVDGPTGVNEGSFFNGGLDEIRVYNRALSASEVKQLYNMGK